MPRYFAIIAAAGSGTRFGAEIPKQYAIVAGKPVIAHAIDRLAAGLPLARIYVALSQDDAWFATVRDDVIALRCGAATRAMTVANALHAIDDAHDDDWIVIHDAVRPCVDQGSLARLHDELVDDPVGGLLAIPASSTLKRSDDSQRSVATESREGVWLAQTPQVFRCSILRRALSRAGFENATDEAQAVEAVGFHPKLVRGSAMNIKITYPDDLALAAAILA